MLKIITTLTVFLIGMLAKGQVSENRTIADFSKVNVTGNIELIYSENPSTSLRIESTNPEILKNTIAEVDSKTLNIYLTEGTSIAANETVQVYLSAHDISALAAHTKAKITIKEQLHASRMSILLDSGATLTGNIKSSGKAKLYASSGTLFNGRIETPVFKGNFSKDAKINLTGKATKAFFQLTDSALLSARNFIAGTVQLNANEVSVAKVCANNSIALNVNGNANVSYIGLPESVVMNEEAQASVKSKKETIMAHHEIAMETSK